MQGTFAHRTSSASSSWGKPTEKHWGGKSLSRLYHFSLLGLIHTPQSPHDGHMATMKTLDQASTWSSMMRTQFPGMLRQGSCCSVFGTDALVPTMANTGRNDEVSQGLLSTCSCYGLKLSTSSGSSLSSHLGWLRRLPFVEGENSDSGAPFGILSRVPESLWPFICSNWFRLVTWYMKRRNFCLPPCHFLNLK